MTTVRKDISYGMGVYSFIGIGIRKIHKLFNYNYDETPKYLDIFSFIFSQTSMYEFNWEMNSICCRLHCSSLNISFALLSISFTQYFKL